MKRVTPMKAIRLKCLDCSADSMAEVRACQVKGCPLWEYRSGHRPKPTVTEGGETRTIVRTGAKDRFGNLEGTQASAMNAAIINGSKTPEELAEATGLTLSRVNNHLKFLVANGHVELVKNKIKIVKGK